MKFDERQKMVLVYQCGIANVFEVDCFNLSHYGRKAKRLYQGTFHGAENFAMGAGAAGATVMTAFCDQAGDISDSTWTEGIDGIFSDQRVEIRLNTASSLGGLRAYSRSDPE